MKKIIGPWVSTSDPEWGSASACCSRAPWPGSWGILVFILPLPLRLQGMREFITLLGSTGFYTSAVSGVILPAQNSYEGCKIALPIPNSVPKLAHHLLIRHDA